MNGCLWRSINQRDTSFLAHWIYDQQSHRMRRPTCLCCRSAWRHGKRCFSTWNIRVQVFIYPRSGQTWMTFRDVSRVDLVDTYSLSRTSVGRVIGHRWNEHNGTIAQPTFQEDINHILTITIGRSPAATPCQGVIRRFSSIIDVPVFEALEGKLY
jgi:hypothetical protein